MRNKSTRVGILTLYYNSINYGGILQAYALSKWLLKNEMDPVMINYDRTKHKKSLSNFIKSICKDIIKKNHCSEDKFKERKQKFSDFKLQYMTETKEVYNINTISQCVTRFDCFIAGSDQIWNGISKGVNTPFLLDFVPREKKKISYAASLTKLPLSDSQIPLYTHLLNRLDSISVREDEGQKYLSKIIADKKISITVDPTQLLSRKEWDDIVVDRIISEPYIFVYMLGVNSTNISIIEKYAKDKEVKIAYIMNASGRNGKEELILHFEYLINNAGPREFLSLIKHADMIITDSFHAASFAVIYRKELLVLSRHDAPQMASRIHTLLSDAGISERFFDQEIGLSDLLSLDEINYHCDKLNEKIDFSRKFLLDSIGDERKEDE